MNVDELTLRHQISQLEYKTECQKIENDLLQAEVERLRHEVEFLKENRDAFMLLAGRMISDSDKLGGSND